MCSPIMFVVTTSHLRETGCENYKADSIQELTKGDYRYWPRNDWILQGDVLTCKPWRLLGDTAFLLWSGPTVLLTSCYSNRAYCVNVRKLKYIRGKLSFLAIQASRHALLVNATRIHMLATLLICHKRLPL